MNITYIHPHTGNINVGSYRLQALVPSNTFNAYGHKSVVVKTIDEAFATDANVIVCMQVLDVPKVLEKLRQLDSPGKVVAFQSDGPLLDVDSLKDVHAIVVDCSLLRHTIPYEYRHKVYHIPTPLEIGGKYKAHQHPRRKLRHVYVGAKGNFFFAADTIRGLKNDGYDISVLSDLETADIPWNVETYADELDKFDVGIIPYPKGLQVKDDHGFSNFLFKDPSRPTLLQAIGLPVVMSPLPSYLEYIKSDEQGFFADSYQQWISTLNTLQYNIEAYNTVAQRGHVLSWNYCARTVVAQSWLDVFNQLFQTRQSLNFQESNDDQENAQG